MSRTLTPQERGSLISYYVSEYLDSIRQPSCAQMTAQSVLWSLGDRDEQVWGCKEEAWVHANRIRTLSDRQSVRCEVSLDLTYAQGEVSGSVDALWGGNFKAYLLDLKLGKKMRVTPAKFTQLLMYAEAWGMLHENVRWFSLYILQEDGTYHWVSVDSPFLAQWRRFTRHAADDPKTRDKMMKSPAQINCWRLWEQSEYYLPLPPICSSVLN